MVFGFLIATVFWIVVLGWQAAYAPTEMEKQQCYEAAQKSSHKSEECKTLWERTTSDPVAFFTFWLVISTIGLGISTVMLWLAGEKQFRHARRTSIVQSRDMQDSIEVARRAAIATENAFTLTERAFVFVRDARIEIHKDPMSRQIVAFAGKIVWENSGDTPTKNLRIHTNLRLFSTLLPGNFDFPDVNPTRASMLIGPKAAASTMPLVILAHQLKDVRDGIAHLYMYGWAEYNDIFPGTKRHRTEFCHKWLISGDITATESFGAQFIWHDRYNGADDDCIKPLQTT
jgi:hypothetical protein